MTPQESEATQESVDGTRQGKDRRIRSVPGFTLRESESDRR
jgi:hypothetical protein